MYLNYQVAYHLPVFSNSCTTILDNIRDDLNAWILLTEVFTNNIHQLPSRSLIRHNAVNLNQWAHPYISLQERQQRIRPVKLSVMVNQCKHPIIYSHLSQLCGQTSGAATVRKIALTRRHPITIGCA